jgi:beta-lactamase superfamily II metal-dependent hydrolase
MWVTIKVTEAFATFPFGWFYVPKPGVWLFLFYFTLLAFLVFQGWRSSSKARWLRYPAVLTGLTWILFSFPGWVTTQLTVLPVSGTPLHADFAGLKSDVLVNCSSEYEMDTLLKRYLRAEGVGTLQNVILARADAAHSGGFFSLLNEFKPKQVYTSAWKSRSSIYKRILRILEQMPNRWTQLAAGAKAEMWQLLHPKDIGQFTRAADQALVLLGEIQGWTVLYLPGPGTKAQEELRHTLKAVHADIVVASIGERDEMPDPSLIQQLKPRVLIIGNSGYSNKERAVERAESLRGTCDNVLDTQSNGAIRLKFRDGTCEIEPMNGLPLLIHR